MSNNNLKTSPVYAREFSFLFLYQFVYQNQQELAGIRERLDQSIDEFLPMVEFQLDKTAMGYAYKIISYILEKEEELVVGLAEFIQGRKFESVDSLEKSALLLAAAEAQVNDELDKGIIINESLELAKKYGVNKGTAFINAVLDKYLGNAT